MKAIIYLLTIAALSFVLLKVLVLLLEPKLTFFPSKEIPKTPRDFGVEFRDLTIPTSDGSTVSAWYLHRDDALADFIFFHGNAGNISMGRLDLVLTLFEQHYNVLVFDYRGYGQSPGSPDEVGICLDGESVARFHRDELYRGDRKVIYFGRSLGGVTASFAAAKIPPDGLILEATFPDKKTLLSHFPALMRFLALFSRYELPTIRHLEQVHCPILVIHGDRDEIVPFQVGEELFQRIQGNKELFVVPGASHADQYVVGGDQYWARLRSFVERLETPE